MSDQVHNYALLRLIVRYGNAAAAALALAILAGFLVAFAVYAFPSWILAAALGAAIVFYGLLRSYVEIVQLICETLLPR